MTLSDQELIAYADGELAGAKRARVEAAIAADPKLAARLAAHRALAAQLTSAFDPVAREPAPERLIAAVSAGRPAGATVIPFPARRPAARRPAWLGGGAVAASLALGLVLGRVFWVGQGGWIGDDLTAHGPLAQALNTQLTGAATDSAVKIGVSFRAADGPICRTFSVTRGKGFDGLACRRGSAWALRIAVPATGDGQTGDYRTAASTLPAPVADLAQSLAAGPAFDAAAEAKARSDAWR